MSTSAFTSTIVLGVLVGTVLLSVGVYLIYRYTNIQCWRSNAWSQHHAVRLGRASVDIEAGAWSRGSKHTGYRWGLGSAIRKRELVVQGEMLSYETQGPARLRGRHEGGKLGGERRVQKYVPRPARAHVQSAARPRTVGWGHQVAMYDDLRHAPAVFQQAMPMTCYAYVSPGWDEVGTYGRLSSGARGVFEGRIEQLSRQPLGMKIRNRGEGYSGPIRSATATAQWRVEPLVCGRGYVEVVEEYPAFLEVTRKEDSQSSGKQDERVTAPSQRSSSTELGVISSRQSLSSTEDLARDVVPNSARQHPQNYLRCSIQGRGTGEVQVDGDRYLQRPH